MSTNFKIYFIGSGIYLKILLQKDIINALIESSDTNDKNNKKNLYKWKESL